MLYFPNKTISKDCKELSFGSFLVRSLFYQILLVALIFSGLLCYFYFHWQERSSSEVENIKQVISSNLKQYSEMLSIIETKLSDKSGDLQDILDVKKYNQLLGIQKDYVKISEAYIVQGKDNMLVNSKNGKKLFAILPPKEFFEHLKQNQTQAYIQGEALYITKSTKGVFIVLKLDLQDFIKVATQFLKLTGTFALHTSKDDNTAIDQLYNLHVKYTKSDFLESVTGDSSMLYSVLLLFLCSSLIWAVNFKKLFKCYTNVVNLEKLEDRKCIQSLTKDLNVLNECKTNLELSVDATRSFLKSLVFVSRLPFDNSNTEQEQKCSLSKIIYDCRSVVYKDLYENKIECEIEISTEKNVELETAVTLYILITNFLYRSLYKTPRSGKISVKLHKSKNQTLIRIEDHGFDLTLRNNTKGSVNNLVILSDLDLEELAQRSNIGVVKLRATQNNIIDLVIPDNDHRYSINANKPENVIEFTKKI